MEDFAKVQLLATTRRMVLSMPTLNSFYAGLVVKGGLVPSIAIVQMNEMWKSLQSLSWRNVMENSDMVLG